MRATQALGAYGERVAARYLTDAGLVILDRRWRCRLGELDLVARDGACLVVCEVKTRRSHRAGTALEAVTPAKLARLRRLAAVWLAEHGSTFREVRIDVVAVSVPRTGCPHVEHLQAVV